MPGSSRTRHLPPVVPGAAHRVRPLVARREEELRCRNGSWFPVPWVQRFTGADAATLIEHDSLAILRGSSQEIADELQRRRDTLGCSYIIVNGSFIEQFAPVVELLAGR